MDKQTIKHNVSDRNQWKRILYMLLFGVILYLVMIVLWIIVVIQAIFALLTASPNSEIVRFSADLVIYLRQIAAFLTYNDETKPYPYQAWQTTESKDELTDAGSAASDSENTDTKSDL
jgi:hypothetical protein